MEKRATLARYRNRSVFAQSSGGGAGTRLAQGLVVILLLALAGGVIFLGFWDIQPPSQTVEKVIPNERFLP